MYYVYASFHLFAFSYKLQKLYIYLVMYDLCYENVIW